MMCDRIKGKAYRWMICLSFVIYHLAFCVACYRAESPTPDGWIPTEEQMDSISFYTTHHYSQNFNFIVVADSLSLIVQDPAEAVGGLPVDTIGVRKSDRIVVADIVMLRTDTVDSVWVQVARDEETIGWAHETYLLKAVAPDNLVSRFIDFFSDTHLLIMLAVVVVGLALFIVRRLYRRHSPIVHFRDIGSFYPTLLALLISVAAVFYSSIQLLSPESWRHYYYHPSLNPLSLPLHLAIFLALVWTIIIVGLAVLGDIYRKLSTGQAVLYLFGLAAVCSVDYVVFSVLTLYYVGYPLLIAYIVFALWRYFRYSRPRYLCGNCGTPLRNKGICPNCGAENV